MAWRSKAVLSLTFDDGLPCQIKYALPAMREHKIRGTFYLIKESDYDDGCFPKEAWLSAQADGQEIGSHSVTHKKAADLGTGDAFWEAHQSRAWIEEEFGKPCTTFCYPYTDAPAHLQQAVRRAGYLGARGGRIARVDKCILKKSDFNRFNVPCYHIADAVITDGQAADYVEEALRRNAWITFMFHSIGPCERCTWDNVRLDTFVSFLEFLQRKEREGLWVAPFGEALKCAMS